MLKVAYCPISGDGCDPGAAAQRGHADHHPQRPAAGGSGQEHACQVRRLALASWRLAFVLLLLASFYCFLLLFHWAWLSSHRVLLSSHHVLRSPYCKFPCLFGFVFIVLRFCYTGSCFCFHLCREAFNIADDILRQGVRGICDIITVTAAP